MTIAFKPPKIGLGPVLSLWLTQVFWSTSTTLIVTITGLAGFALAPERWLATLPIALGGVLSACSTIPVTRCFMRYGRKKVFFIGGVIGLLSTSGLTFSVATNNFPLLCLSYAAFGIATAITLSYRFAATELLERRHFASLHALFIFAGLVASIVGPMIAGTTMSRQGAPDFVLAYGFATAIATCSLITVAFFRDSKPRIAHNDSERLKPVQEARLFVAVLAGGVAVSSMMFLMLGAPILMRQHDLTGRISSAMQAHFISMYIPGLFTGLIVRKLGLRAVLILGAIIGLTGSSLVITGLTKGYMFPLIFVGVSWGLITVAGATIVSNKLSHRAEMVYNFTIAGVSAATSFGVSAATVALGWIGINALCVLLFLLLAITCIKLNEHGKRRRRLWLRPRDATPLGNLVVEQ